jgi:hypothetical protein
MRRFPEGRLTLQKKGPANVSLALGTLGGHRLSSLYRSFIPTLISSWLRYSGEFESGTPRSVRSTEGVPQQYPHPAR